MEETTRKFEADVGRVLDLVVHSLYSHKDIFLRELVANASDALDRLRFRALSDEGLMGDDPALEIRIGIDRDNNLLWIEDTGIGMTEEELVYNLGTIAHSGSRAFMERVAAADKADVNLIGQFGVGFYSAYLVAERVEVITRAAGNNSQSFKWSSDGRTSYSIEPADRASRGTQVLLRLRSSETEFLEERRLRELCQRHLDYVRHPIRLQCKTAQGTEFQQVNRASALWRRPKSQVAAADYEDFYKHLSRDFSEPLAHLHFKTEGSLDMFGLLFIPRRAPYDVNDAAGRRRSLRMFVRQMFVMDDCEDILPSWLRFVRGVIDSDDLPLNVSRQTFQGSAVVAAVRAQIVKRVLNLLAEMAKDRPEQYVEFWNAFGPILKEGLALDGDDEYKRTLTELVRYESTHGKGLTSLAEYVARAPAGQDAIYYIYAPSKVAVAGSPYLEGLLVKGYEVLFMTDPVDEWAVGGIGEFEGKRLISAMRADLPLPSAHGEEARQEQVAQDLKPLCDRMVKVLAEHVREVKPSARLTESPCCVVSPPGSTSAYMEQLLTRTGRAVPHSRRILEVNPGHPVIGNLLSLLERQPDSPRIDEIIEVLHTQAVLNEGGSIPDPHRVAKHLGALLTYVVTPPAAQPVAE
ncbi:MAG TPA: molecular chaperone HtpG [Polyangia bacterium]|nr:molecular chaperone HtpG [Polyangia bacterium]